MGPVEEFGALGFMEANPSETFVKISVGTLTKPDDRRYSFSRLYPVVNHGNWTINKKPDQVEFIHELNDKDILMYLPNFL